MSSALRIVEDNLSGPEVVALLQYHLDEMYALFPPEEVFALPLERMREPDVTCFAAWDGACLAGCGALKELDSTHGEIKSMRAAPNYRGKGVGKAILRHMLDVARRRGYARVSLETGAIPELLPARALYESHGFEPCGPFGEYSDNLASAFMTRLI